MFHREVRFFCPRIYIISLNHLNRDLIRSIRLDRNKYMRESPGNRLGFAWRLVLNLEFVIFVFVRGYDPYNFKSSPLSTIQIAPGAMSSQ